jgi:hypothetical protein
MPVVPGPRKNITQSNGVHRIPATALSKAWACVRSLAGIAGSIPAMPAIERTQSHALDRAVAGILWAPLFYALSYQQTLQIFSISQMPVAYVLHVTCRYFARLDRARMMLVVIRETSRLMIFMARYLCVAGKSRRKICNTLTYCKLYFASVLLNLVTLRCLNCCLPGNFSSEGTVILYNPHPPLPPSLLFNSVSSRGYSDRNLKLIPHLHLLPRLKIVELCPYSTHMP